MKKIGFASIFAALLIGVSLVQAYELSEDRWPQASTLFYVDIPGADGLWNSAFEAAMARWNDRTVFDFRIVRGEYADPCSNPDENPERNGVRFSDTFCGDNWGSSTLALTSSWSINGVRTQSGIVFNKTKDWNVYNGPARAAVEDFRRVAVHELGHALGLGHEDDVPSIMQPSISIGDTIEVPQADDIAGVAALYGGASPPPGGTRPPNDFFSNALTISGPSGRTTGSNVNATSEPGEPLGGFPLSSVWWQWRAPSSGTVTIDTAGSDFDTTLGVYTGTRIGALRPLAENDDAVGLGRQSRATLDVTAGTVYRLRIAGYNGATGSIVLNWNLETPPPPGGTRPPNDFFSNALTISGPSGRTTGSNVNATSEPGEPLGGFPLSSVWWQWRAPSSGTVTIDTAGSDFDTTLGVYTGTRIGALRPLAENDDAVGLGRQSRATLDVTAGTVYRLRIAGYNGATGSIVLNWNLTTSPTQTGDQIYYFPHLAVGAGWQTTITYINFSPQEVTCRTEFISDHGSPLMVSFAGLGPVVSRTDVLSPGGSVHEETNVELSAPLAPGWARASCSGPVKASLLFRQRNSEGVPVSEAAVNAAAAPATRFVTFAEQGEGQFGTGVAYANPSDTATLITFTAKDASGQTLASVDQTLVPNGHGAQNMAPLFALSRFTGSLEITSTEPIVTLSLNFEADPVFSSLPPGELDAAAPGTTTYYFPHLAVGAGWQTTITYINYSPQEVTCQTDFLSDHGSSLMVSFAGLGAVVSRTEVLPPGGSVHEETNVELSAPLAPGWARASCSGPVKASLLFRRFEGGVPMGEAGVNAVTLPATRFVTFAEQGEGQFGTGVAYANPSDTAALVTFMAKNVAGQTLASVDRTLLPNGHDAQNMVSLFGLSSFTGSLEITSTEPIVTLSLNFEADPVFSSLPPGEIVNLPDIPDAPDLVVQTPSVSDSSPNAGESFTLSATVRNQGNGQSASTVLRYYRSSDASISAGDTQVGTDAVAGLAASGSGSSSVQLTAPSNPGTYYYGACVDSVAEELDTTNNCSSAVSVTVTTSNGPGGLPAGESFDLDPDNYHPWGITFANGRFYVGDGFNHKVFAYTASGQRDSASDFDLDRDHFLPHGITFANGRFYVVDNSLDGEFFVFAYMASGQRDAASDFDLDPDNNEPTGITFANGRFYVGDDLGNLQGKLHKVFAYTASGQRDSASDFDLDPDNNSPAGITFANGRFYVVNRPRRKHLCAPYLRPARCRFRLRPGPGQ